MSTRVAASLNIVRDMLEQEKKRQQERAQELLDDRKALDEASAHWNEIQSLGEHPGWARLVRMADAEVERLRQELEKPVGSAMTAALRAGIKDLRWLVDVPSQAALVLAEVERQRAALQFAEDDFVKFGA